MKNAKQLNIEKMTEVSLEKLQKQAEKPEKNAKQMAVAYIIYMMGGTYFKTCKAKNKLKERNLFMYYKGLSVKNQLRLERQADRALSLVLSESDLKCEVFFKEGKELEVKFDTGLTTLSAFVKEDGTYYFVSKNEEAVQLTLPEAGFKCEFSVEKKAEVKVKLNTGFDVLSVFVKPDGKCHFVSEKKQDLQKSAS